MPTLFKHASEFSFVPPLNEARSSIFSSAVRFGYGTTFSIIEPVFFMASVKLSKTSAPIIRHDPESGRERPVSIFIAVVFPAPLGPRKPNISPFSISKLTFSMPRPFLYFFVREMSSIAFIFSPFSRSLLKANSWYRSSSSRLLRRTLLRCRL